MRVWKHFGIFVTYLKWITLTWFVLSLCFRLIEWSKIHVPSVKTDTESLRNVSAETKLSSDNSVANVASHESIHMGIQDRMAELDDCDVIKVNHTGIWRDYWTFLNSTKGGYRQKKTLQDLERYLAKYPYNRRTPTIQQYNCWMKNICRTEKHASNTSDTNLCPCVPSQLDGDVNVLKDRLTKTSWRELEVLLPEVKVGGQWSPSGCVARRRVAVIVPSRDRETHLRAFLAHMHPILQKQQLEYRIFVVEQNLPYMFNKAAIMNACFLEVKKMFEADCVLFHDVDTFIKRDDNMVMCGDQPIHWAAYSDRFKFRNDPRLFGSGVLVRPDVFESVNGFTNLFFGWGAEDDNLKHRFYQHEIFIYRPPLAIGKCTLIEHERDRLFALSHSTKQTKYKIFYDMHTDPTWQKIDGLKFSAYEVVDIKMFLTHTWILVNLKAPSVGTEDNKYIQAAQRITRIPFETTPAQYAMSQRNCSVGPPMQKRHFLSRVTCRYLCDIDQSCVMMEYHAHPTTELDAYCMLREQSECDKYQPYELTEIHQKVSQ